MADVMIDVKETGQRIEWLLDSLTSAGEPQLRMHAEELVGLLVSLYGEGLRRIVSLAGEQVLSRLASDELVSELLVLHGLHPVDVETRVRAVIGTSASLVGVDAAGVARLRLPAVESGCGCGSSPEDGPRRLEAALLAAVSDLTAVEFEQVAAQPAKPLIPVDSLFRNRSAEVAR